MTSEEAIRSLARIVPKVGVSNVDRITNFNAFEDTIRLGDAIFAGLANGVLAASTFAENLTDIATDVLSRIIYETDTRRQYFDANGTQVGARVHFATLKVNLALTTAGFFVF